MNDAAGEAKKCLASCSTLFTILPLRFKVSERILLIKKRGEPPLYRTPCGRLKVNVP